MMSWKTFFRRFPSSGISFAAKIGIEPGLYHYQRQADAATVRFHLRVDSAGNGLLLVNASSAVRLHPSGVVIAKGILDGQDEDTIVTKLNEIFSGVSAQQAAADLMHV